MTIIKIFLWFIIIPFILGKYLEKKDDNKILYSWALGNTIQMAVFFVIALPMVLAKISFFVLWKVYLCIIILLTIVSLIIFRKRFLVKPTFEKPVFFQIIAILLILIQLFIKVKYANINNDDSEFLGSATQMQYNGYMYYTEDNEKLQSRRALAPISAYYATLSEITGAPVAVVTHSVMPIFIITLSYLIYYYLGSKIFENKDYLYIMLILFSTLNLYAFSVKGINRYLILYSWFGRAILAGACLPFIWNIALDAMEKEKNKVLDWITLFIVVLASCLCSEMAVPLVSISIMALAFVNSIRDKKISYILKSALMIIPCVIVGVIYILIK